MFPLSKIRHFSDHVDPLSLISQMCVESLVSLEYRLWVNALLWFPNLVLKSVEQIPTYVLIVFLFGMSVSFIYAC